jgi:hypothetical protein
MIAKLIKVVTGSVEEVVSMLGASGFRVTSVSPLDGYVVANKLLVAEKI